MHDDELYLNKGISLYKFSWLGGYNNLTLAKGPFYSIFLALNYVIGIPLLISETLLYLFACLLVILVIRKKVNNDNALLFLFILVVFNPITYTLELRRVVREGIYPALGLLTIFSFIKVYVTDPENIINKRKWIWISGILLSCFWLTKEDGIWIIPALLFICIYFLLNNYLKLRKFSWRPLLLAGAPFFILFLVINLFSVFNKLKYNSYNAVDFKNAEFVRAYASLMRVKAEKPLPFVPVTKETRERLYKIIPAFGELKEAETKLFQAWAKENSYCETIPETCGEIGGGWFVWALRDAVAAKGYYKDGKTAQDYYMRLANEINAACDCQKLDCYPESNSMVPPLNKSHIEPFKNAFLHAWRFSYHFEKFSVNDGESWGDEHQKFRFEEFTRSRLAGEKRREQYDINNSIPKIKRLILGGIGFIYQIIAPVFFWVSLLCMAIVVFFTIRSRSVSTLTIITVSLLIAITCRIIILALVHITSFPAIGNLYLSPVHPLLLTMIFLPVFEVYQFYKSRKLKG